MDLSSSNQKPSTHATYSPEYQALCQTVMAYLVTPNHADILVRVLFDNASDLVLIRKKVAEDIGLIGKEVTLKLIVSGNQLSIFKHQRSVNFKLKSFDGTFVSEDISACTIPSISKKLRKIDVDPSEFQHLQDLPWSEQLPNYTESHFDILLGEPYNSKFKQEDMRKGSSIDMPSAQKTSLGWTLMGSILKHNHNHHSLSQKIVQETSTCALETKIQQFWELEHIGLSELGEIDPTMTLEETEAEKKMSALTSYDPETCRYTTGLLWRDGPIKDNNRSKAIAVAHKFTQRFLNDPERKLQIDRTYMDLIKNDFASFVQDVNITRNVYTMETFPVFRPGSTTSVRIVFNCKSKSKDGYSLNEKLLPGSCLIQNLVKILLRFRLNPFCCSLDLHKYFHQIKVRSQDRSYLQFCWGFQKEILEEMKIPHDPNAGYTLKFMNMNVLSMGLCSSPYQSAWILRHHAERFKKKLPEASLALIQQSYIDDINFGALDVSTCRKLLQDIKYILDSASFASHKFVSNANEQILKDIDPKDIVTADIVKILGISWDYKTDFLIWPFLEKPKEFSTSSNEEEIQEQGENCQTLEAPVPILETLKSETWTKRQVFSVCCSIFQPLGLLSPFLLKGKLIMRESWRLKILWDQNLEGDLLKDFLAFKEELPLLNNYRIERCIIPNQGKPKYIACFGDSSLHESFGCVIYVISQAETSEGTKISSRMAYSKARLHPLKENFSIVRKELQACVITLRCGLFVQEALNLEHLPIFYFTDSLVNLTRISSIEKKWNKFRVWTSRRLFELKEKSNPNQWKFIPGLKNPGHFCTHPYSLKELIGNKLWLEGPEVLVQENPQFQTVEGMKIPSELKKLDDEELIKGSIVHTTNVLDPVSKVNPEFLKMLLTRFEHWKSNVNVFSFMLRFIKNTRNKVKCNKFKGDFKKIPPIDVDEKKITTVHFIRLAQHEVYGDIIDCLRTKNEIPYHLLKKHKVENLMVIWDENSKLLKMDSRLKFSSLLSQVGNPILLPSKHTVTTQLVKYFHKNTLHSSVEQTLCDLRRVYWIHGSRRTVKSILRNCNCKPPKKCFQVLAKLPDLRTNMSQAWRAVSADFAGPISLKEGNEDTHKVYICLFTCMYSRMIHLELTWNLTTESFLRALRKLTSRRGKMDFIYTDWAKYYQAAAKELKRLLTKLDWNNIKKTSADQFGTTWLFTPAPHYPESNSVSERMIRSVKAALKVAFGASNIVPKKHAKISFDELETLLIEIECLLNNRPIGMGNLDSPQEPVCITPSELVIGRTAAILPDDGKINVNAPLSQKWSNRKRALNAFWRRFVQSYLLDLSTTKINHKQFQPILQPGMAVQIRDNNIPKGVWINGIIQAVHPSPLDGLIRKVTVKTTSGKTLLRPVNRISLFEHHLIEDDQLELKSAK